MAGRESKKKTELSAYMSATFNTHKAERCGWSYDINSNIFDANGKKHPSNCIAAGDDIGHVNYYHRYDYGRTMKPSQRLIISKSASYYGVPAKYLKERTREAKYTIPRWTAMYLCQKLRQDSFKRIGMGFDRDHSTVMHGISALIARMNDNPDLKLQVQEIEGMILHRVEVMKATMPPPKFKPSPVAWDFTNENLRLNGINGSCQTHPPRDPSHTRYAATDRGEVYATNI